MAGARYDNSFFCKIVFAFNLKFNRITADTLNQALCSLVTALYPDHTFSTRSDILLVRITHFRFPLDLPPGNNSHDSSYTLERYTSDTWVSRSQIQSIRDTQSAQYLEPFGISNKMLGPLDIS